ncbi:MAG: hypothetical protein ACOC93_00085 [Planctomycetota bacterium]
MESNTKQQCHSSREGPISPTVAALREESDALEEWAEVDRISRQRLWGPLGWLPEGGEADDFYPPLPREMADRYVDRGL